MTPWPVYFGAPAERLFGWVHAPEAPHRGTGVVLCPPVGYEHLCSYTTLRQLAEELAADGFYVLRFDYPCTGDSAGACDRVSVASWLSGVRAAVDELRRVASLERIAVVGLRMGATLAATAAARWPGIDGLVLWAPFRSGRAFRRELIALGGGGGAPGSGESLAEAGGFAYPAAMLEEFASIDLTALERAPAPAVLIVWRDDLKPDAKLTGALAATGAVVDEEQPAGTAQLVRGVSYEVDVPDAVLGRIRRWLRSRFPDRTDVRAPVRGIDSPCCMVRPDVVETPVRFGAEGLFGIMSEPASGRRQRDTALAFLNTGVDHRIGTSRMSVTLARNWAALGYRVLRFDLAGIGDSPAPAGGGKAAPYSPNDIDQVRSAVTFVHHRGAERAVVVGLCSGGHTAMRAVLHGLPVTGACAMNPQLYWRTGDSLRLQLESNDLLLEGRRVRQSARSRKKWVRLLTGRIDVKATCRVLLRHARAWSRDRDAVRRAREAVADMRALGAAPVPSFVVFSEGDPGLRYLHTFAPRGIESLPARSSLRIAELPGADHTFTARHSRDSLETLLTEYLTAVHP